MNASASRLIINQTVMYFRTEQLHTRLRAPLQNRVFGYVFIFAIYFVTAKLGQYIFFDLGSSPAFIWPPVGIALAAILLGGYRMIIPILFAQFLATLTRYGLTVLPFLSVTAYTVQPIVAAYSLQRLGIHTSLDRLRDMQLFICGSFFFTMIAPTILAIGEIVAHDSVVSDPLVNWARMYAGGIFSTLMIVPLALTWFTGGKRSYSFAEQFEFLAAFLILTGVDVFLFWTTDGNYLGISIIFILPIVLLWFALRMSVKWLSLGLFLTAVIGVSGSFFTHPIETIAFSRDLLSNEIYIGLIAAIYLIFVAIVQERRDAFDRLQKNNAQLEVAFDRISADARAKSDFIAILSHELRNPLAPIVSAHEWLLMQPQSAEAHRAIENAQRNALMMRRLLDDLLDTARMTQHGPTLRKENVLLKDVIDQSVDATKDFLRSKSHRMRVQMPRHDVWICADPVRLKQVVMNLVNNAIKYTDPGGDITLMCAVNGEELSIAVADSGMGISRDQHHAIFEPFRQLPRSSLVGTGLGIGLALAKSLVEMHGGTIEVDSSGIGSGSTFTVRMPVVIKSAPAHDTSAAHDDEHKQKILIVDDNEQAAEGLKRLLSYSGHEVAAAYTGHEGFEAVFDFKPDIILLDIGLPDIDGYRVARNLREAGWDRALIALSGYGQESDRAKAKRAGFDVHLTKPISIKHVIDVIRELQTAPI